MKYRPTNIIQLLPLWFFIFLLSKNNVKSEINFQKIGFDHINRNAPVLVRSPKLTRFEPAQYWGGRPPGNSVVLNPFYLFTFFWHKIFFNNLPICYSMYRNNYFSYVQLVYILLYGRTVRTTATRVFQSVSLVIIYLISISIVIITNLLFYV